jgi:hypothetical protein
MNTPSGSGSEATNSPTLVARLRAPIERYSAWARSHQRSEAVDKRWSAACVMPCRSSRTSCRCASVGPIRGSRTSSLVPIDELAWSIGKTVDCMIGLVSSRTCSVQRGASRWQPFLDRYLASCRDDPGSCRAAAGYLALFPVFWFRVLLAEGLRRAESHTLDGWLVNDLDPNLRGGAKFARARLTGHGPDCSADRHPQRHLLLVFETSRPRSGSFTTAAVQRDSPRQV